MVGQYLVCQTALSSKLTMSKMTASSLLTLAMLAKTGAQTISTLMSPLAGGVDAGYAVNAYVKPIENLMIYGTMQDKNLAYDPTVLGA